MAWSEKFESGANEKWVVVNTAKHRHEAALIKKIEVGLGRKFGGTWTVRANSYTTKQMSGKNCVDIDELNV
jgi:hypothetical protein